MARSAQRPSARTLVASAALCATLVSPAAASQPGFLWLSDVAPAGYRVLSAGNISGNGLVVVGVAQGPTGTIGYKWSAAEGIVLLPDPTPGPDESLALAVNFDGSAVAGVGREVGFSGPGDVGNGYRAVVWRDGQQPEVLPTPAPPFDDAEWVKGMSADGRIVLGDANETGRLVNGRKIEVVRWVEGVLLPVAPTPTTPGLNQREAGGMSDDGRVVSLYSNRNTGGAYWWPYVVIDGAPLALPVPPQNTDAYTSRVSNAGRFVAGWQYPGARPQTRGLLWDLDNGTVQVIMPTADVPSPRASDVSDSGSLVVGFSNVDVVGWLWTPAEGVRSIASVVQSALGRTFPDRRLRSGSAVSPAGDVVTGSALITATNASEGFVFFLSNAPLPTVVQQPQDAAAFEGQTIELRAAATSPVGCGTVRYQWRRNGVNVSDGPGGASPGGGVVTGASGQLASLTTGEPVALTISAVAGSDAGQYSVVFTSACGDATTAAAVVRVVPPCAPDLNIDGELTFDDIQAFVTLYNAEDPRADFNNDQEWTFDDIQLFVTLYNAGC